MSSATLGLAYLAGLVSILSPCVLPILPLVLGAAVSQSRYGPLVLAGGLAVSFVAIGLFVATIGFAIGLDTGVFRTAAALLFIAMGVALAIPPLQARLATAAGPMSGWIDARFGGEARPGLRGQFGVGLLLGAVWSPCVGPTLGAASVLAAQGQDLGQVTLTMALFGIGAATPLVLLGLVSREALMRWRSRMHAAGTMAKTALGLVFVVLGLFVLTGLDKTIETALVQASPAWLTELTTRF